MNDTEVFLYAGMWGCWIASLLYLQGDRYAHGALFFFAAVFHMVMLVFSLLGVSDLDAAITAARAEGAL